ncbi:methyl-accepting chemotaxis protein [Psychrobium sp. MM17-31]|uniref:methyl-accepting chemotaxis protein n=1 Tax=Psychrobium sp. MM17-31 TaxID=2917758 RepID=UPI001EF63409|nr:methyl-accepting chemotaxis protein [Psychrobium sp. MM17-31]MCG7531435.1 methyl-accepting chemotaxis protein [Psychrobium sp. MM17-31]
MTLTVANRIRLGFGSILLMLFIIAANSYYNFSNVEKETLHSKNVSLPALEISTTLEAQLMKMQRLALQEYYATEIAQLDGYRNAISTAHKKVSSLLVKLQELAAGDDNLSSKLPGLIATVDKIEETTSSLYSSKQSVLANKAKLASTLEQLSEIGDNLSSTLLDISDTESESDQLDSIVGLANDLDNLILTLLKTSEDLSKQADVAKTQAIAKEVSFISADIDSKLKFLVSRSQGIVDTEYLDALNSDYQSLTPLVSGSQSIEAIRINLLQNIEQTSLLSQGTDKQTDKGVEQVERLLQAASHSAEKSEELILKSVNSGITQVVIVLLVAVVISIFVSLRTLNSISQPLNKINKALKALAAGDLTQTVNHSANDEFGALTSNINHLSVSLKEIITSIALGSRQLATASEQTSSITQETTQAIGEQQIQVDQAAAAINEMSLSAGQVADHADSTLSEVKQTNEQAIEIAKISENNKTTITSLSSDISNAAGVINKLHDDSSNIGSIIDVIRGIAEQTNLLALNAAIEAARAGEQGRGFAVVADEVRNLANRTQQSTTEINDMVELIQTGAQDAVKVMEVSQEHALACVSDSEKTSHALHEMSDALVRVEEKSGQISQAAQEQNVVSNEISQLLESIVEIANNTSSGAAQTEQATAEVANLAVELQTAAGNFKV